LDYTSHGSVWRDEPTLVWWYFEGEWKEITENKREVVESYKEVYMGKQNEIWGFYVLGIKTIEIPYMRYRAKVRLNISNARLSGRGQ
jgi:hypothetical protein